MTILADTARSAASGVESEIAQLRAKVATLMADRVTPAIGGAVHDVEAAAQDAAGAVRHQAARFSGAVQARPYAAIGIAALAGFALAALLRR